MQSVMQGAPKGGAAGAEMEGKVSLWRNRDLMTEDWWCFRARRRECNEIINVVCGGLLKRYFIKNSSSSL